ncbi:hypothetical protein [Streptomyces sp. NBC_00996]|uniref:hypothetical protein n=1 Tax=Streptomyces sp. NBC_00996 TaxID=2903710 RepID=UPI003865CD84|nr:hypothetical protein OG390_02900 [Streptomyces sp. NBC_00996]
MVEDRLREALLVQCRSDHVEPPGRVERIVAAARARADRVFCAQTVARLGEARAGRLLTVVAEGNEEGTALLASLKRDPDAVALDLLLAEITKLTAVRRLGLPEGPFADCSEKRTHGRLRRSTPRCSSAVFRSSLSGLSTGQRCPYSAGPPPHPARPGPRGGALAGVVRRLPLPDGVGQVGHPG